MMSHPISLCKEVRMISETNPCQKYDRCPQEGFTLIVDRM